MNNHQVSSTVISELRKEVLDGCHRNDKRKVRSMSDDELLVFVKDELARLYDLANTPILV